MLKDYFNAKRILKITLQGDIPEENQDSVLPFFNDNRLTVLDFYKACRHLIESDFKALFLVIKSLNIGYSRADELRSCIKDIVRSGKGVYVFIENPGNVEYFLASSATKIFIPPWATFNLIGLSIENYFLKELLDNMHIRPEIEGIGHYKSAAETLNRKSMSEKNREMLETILEQQFALFVSEISESRKMKGNDLIKIIDSAPLNPTDAQSKKLIDGVCYESDVSDLIERTHNGDIKTVNYKDFRKSLRIRDILFRFKLFITGQRKYIGYINVSGLITQGSNRTGNKYVKTCGSDTIMELIDKISSDKTVSSLVVRVQSPGGSALASDLIRDRLEKLNKTKPVFISMSDVAASGGYMVSLSSELIFSNPFTVTGSIGIVAGKLNIRDLLNRIGINNEVLQKGQMASIYSTAKGFSRSEKIKFMKIISDMYKEFVSLVTKERKIKSSEMSKIAEGRVWTGPDAHRFKLIDRVCTLGDCINEAKKSLDTDFSDYKIIKVFKAPSRFTLSDISKLGYGDSYGQFAKIMKNISGDKIYALMPNIFEIK